MPKNIYNKRVHVLRVLRVADNQFDGKQMKQFN